MRAENPSERFGTELVARTGRIRVNTVFISLNSPLLDYSNCELGLGRTGY